MSKVNFWMFGFIETKILNIEKRKKMFVIIKVLKIISYNNVKARALGHSENVNTFCDNLEQAMAQLGKNYSPSNIYNLRVGVEISNDRM